MDKVRHRLAAPTDKNLIMDSWLREYQHSQWARNIQQEVYFRSHRPLVEQLLDLSHTLIACDTRDPDLIFGYVVGVPHPEAVVVHWMYTRRPLREHGIARGLLQSLGHKEGVPIVTSHMTKDWAEYMGNYITVYNPYIIFEPYRELIYATQEENVDAEGSPE